MACFSLRVPRAGRAWRRVEGHCAVNSGERLSIVGRDEACAGRESDYTTRAFSTMLTRSIKGCWNRVGSRHMG